jgi:hypothetical protein
VDLFGQTLAGHPELLAGATNPAPDPSR